MKIPRAARPLWRFLTAFALVIPLIAVSMDGTPVLAAPLTTQDLTQGKTAQELATGLVGAGVTISNVTYTGAQTAAGSFGGGGDVVGFEGGIILSSGKVANVISDASSFSASFGHGGAGDTDLNALLTNGVTTKDAAVLQFDFTPQSGKIYFEYVFASEEYNTFVGSSYNDVFGFFVNGTNCARVNGQPVSINTINKGQNGTSTGTNGQYFINNELTPSPRRTAMDGLTTVLVCDTNVNAGTTNHLKLAIADAQDTLFDTAVFIKAGSLSTTPPPTYSPPPTSGGTPPGCLTPGTLDFGTQTIGSNAPTQLALLNNCGNVPLAIGSVTKGGTNANDYDIVSSCTGTTVPTGSNCGIRVLFHPAAAGTRTATVTVAFTGGTSVLNLTGIGAPPVPPFDLTVLTNGNCTVGISPNPGPYTSITTVTLTPQPAAGWVFIYWRSERGFMGWADPWTFQIDADHTVTAYCVPIETFTDYSFSGQAKNDPVIRMTALSIIKGYGDGRFGPGNTTQRAQMAALICRGMGFDRPQTWDKEDHGNPFIDRNGLDAALWRAVGTLYYYNVGRGYDGVVFGPTDGVTKAQTISFFTRAMVLNGYWVQQPDNPAVYPNVPTSSGHRNDIATYVFYAGTVPGTGSTGQSWSDWNAFASRQWFSEAEWKGLNDFFTSGYTP